MVVVVVDVVIYPWNTHNIAICATCNLAIILLNSVPSASFVTLQWVTP